MLEKKAYRKEIVATNTIDRFPNGTEDIPFPHKIFNWKNGNPTMTIDVPSSWHFQKNPPKFVGWKVFFVSFFGYDNPIMNYSYKKVEG